VALDGHRGLPHLARKVVDSEALCRQFIALYGGELPRLFSAPGRINLIGEHTDYNDGFVLPLAIERRTYVAASPRPDGLVRAFSCNEQSGIEFDLARPGPKRRGSWLDYVEGTAQALRRAGFAVNGANLLVDSDVPVGAGLSASAALELAIGLALVGLANESNPDRLELALAGQFAEHDYVGTMCGIMDQYVVAFGREQQALLIDCRSLASTPIPLELGSARLLICDTRVKHELASSAYNERRRQCEQGVALLAEQLPGVRALRDVTPDTLAAHAARLPALVAKRCRHVVAENARTLAAAEALKAGRLSELGALMYASHASLRDDYEVSCAELDTAVECTVGVPGVYGSRMTGGGFGGCTVTLVESEAVSEVTAAIEARLGERYRSKPEWLVTRAAQGAREEPTIN
jgi:galactokinase